MTDRKNETHDDIERELRRRSVDALAYGDQKYSDWLDELADRVHAVGERLRNVTVLVGPPRNCDVGTVEEQDKRLREYCSHYRCGDNCPMDRTGKENCVLAWANAPWVPWRIHHG